jgi:hypothetical protein
MHLKSPFHLVGRVSAGDDGRYGSARTSADGGLSRIRSATGAY